MSEELIVGEVTSLETKYKWQIKDFSTINIGIGKPICSPVFCTPHSNNKTLQWRLKLYPNGYNKDNKDYISAYLQSVDKVKVSSKFAVSILNDSDAEIIKQCTQEKRIFRPLQDWGWPKYVQKQMITDVTKCLVKNDRLILCCCIFSTNLISNDGKNDSEDDDGQSEEEEEEDESDEDEDDVIEDHRSKMLGYFEKLFESGDFSDVTVVVEKKRLQLHKAILASLSPIFQATFEQELKDPKIVKEHVYEVNGIKYEIMKEMFRYIYTAKIHHLDDIAADLLMAADRYAVDKLKILCEKSLCAGLNADNALRLLELATKFHTTLLKVKVTELVVSRLSEFVTKAEFKLLSSACKDELLSSIAVKRPKN